MYQGLYHIGRGYSSYILHNNKIDPENTYFWLNYDQYDDNDDNDNVVDDDNDDNDNVVDDDDNDDNDNVVDDDD